MNAVNTRRCHCLSLVRLRNDRANSTPTAVPTMTSSLSSVRPRNVPVAQRGSSFAISPRTILKSTVSSTCANGLSHSLLLSRAHVSTEHVRRVPGKPRQNDALAVNFVAKFLLQHTHVGSREALEPSHSILHRTIRLVRVLRTLSTIVLSTRLTRTAPAGAWMAGSLSTLSNTPLEPQVSRCADGSVAERLWESSVARPTTHASHQLRNVACVTSCSSLFFCRQDQRTFRFRLPLLLDFELTSVHLSPLTRRLLDACATSGKRLDVPRRESHTHLSAFEAQRNHVCLQAVSQSFLPTAHPG